MNYDLIWINGMPRSGTSWLSQIIASSEEVNFKMAPLFSHQFKDKVDENSSKDQWVNFFDEVFITKDFFINQEERKNKGEFMNFQKLKNQKFLCVKDVRYHEVIPTLLNHFGEIKIIHIVRNPCATIYSWMNTKKEFKVNENTTENEWLTGKTRKINKSEYWGFNDWVSLTKHYLILQKKYRKNVYLVSYEDLVDNTNAEVNKLFEFCDIKANEQTQEFLRLSHEKHDENDYSVFKNVSQVKSKWKENLDSEIANQIIQTCKNEGLEFYLK
ncbi:MAG: hypothetical protein COA97_06700 [Flavobacteriales bacterium]|nr:MAG: hypothetical protein COA97_06700 [Flavobacteriales bacterium]